MPLVYGRLPCAHGAALACALLTGQPVPWVSFCQALLMANKFVFVD